MEGQTSPIHCQFFAEERPAGTERWGRNPECGAASVEGSLRTAGHSESDHHVFAGQGQREARAPQGPIHPHPTAPHPRVSVSDLHTDGGS